MNRVGSPQGRGVSLPRYPRRRPSKSLRDCAVRDSSPVAVRLVQAARPAGSGRSRRRAGGRPPTGPVGLLVVEQEEVVADEFHLVERVVDGHRRGRVLLGAHDAPGLVVVDGERRSCELRRTLDVSGSGSTRWPRPPRPASCRRSGSCGGPCCGAVVLSSLLDRRLQGGVEAVGAGLATHDRAAPARGDLDVLTVLALAPVLLMVEFDVEEVDGAVESLQSRQFL